MYKIKVRMNDIDFLQDIILITFFSILASFITPLLLSLNSFGTFLTFSMMDTVPFVTGRAVWFIVLFSVNFNNPLNFTVNFHNP